MARSNTGSTSNYFTNASTPVTGVPCTIASWFNVANVTTFFNLVALTDAGGNAYATLALAGDVGGDPVQAIQSDFGEVTASTSAGFSASTWQHACGVYSATNSRAAYLNGGSKGTNSSSPPSSGHAWANTSVGAFKGSSTSVFSPINGSMAETAVWNVALTDDEVLSLARGVSPRLVRPTGLVAYWPLVGRFSPELDLGNTGAYPLTMTGTMATADHCRVAYAAKPLDGYAAPAAAGFDPATFPWTTAAVERTPQANPRVGVVGY